MKNMDPLNDNVVALFQNSSDPFVSGLWKDTGTLIFAQNSTPKRCKIGKYSFSLQFAGVFCTHTTFVTSFHLLRVELHRVREPSLD